MQFSKCNWEATEVLRSLGVLWKVAVHVGTIDPHTHTYHTHTHTHTTHHTPHTLPSNGASGTRSISQATLASLVLKTDGVLQTFNFSKFYDGYLSNAIMPDFFTYTRMQFLKLRRQKKHVPPKRRLLFINGVENQSAIICPALPASTQ